MPTQIEAVTTSALSAALDAASLRQAVIAANVANAATEGYAPLRLAFESRLEDARAVLREKRWLDNRGIAALRELAEVQPQSEIGASAVQVDVEMTELARNAVQFQALLQGVARHLSLLALAAGDGRK